MKRKKKEMRMKEKQPAVSTKYIYTKKNKEKKTIITKDCLVNNKRPSRYVVCQSLDTYIHRARFKLFFFIIISLLYYWKSGCLVHIFRNVQRKMPGQLLFIVKYKFRLLVVDTRYYHVIGVIELTSIFKGVCRKIR